MAFELLAWFQKKGIDPAKLSDDEKATYEQYKAILSKEELTIDDLRTFLKQERGKIEARWRAYDDKGLIPYYTVYGVILEALDSPLQQRAQLEQFLMKQIQ